MSILSEIETRFRTKCESVFGEIGLVGDLSELKDAKPLILPAAYLFIKEERSDDSAVFGVTRQLTELDIGLMLITQNLSDKRGGAAASDIEALKDASRVALVGWQPASAQSPVENIGGQLVKAANSVVWWEHTFGVSFLLTGSPI